MLYEWRTYHVAPGRGDDLHRRFEAHTRRLFARHGIRDVAYFVPEGRPDLLLYLVSFPDAEAREAAWAAFRADPEWRQVKAESEVDGPLVESIDSTLLRATPYSPDPGR